MKIASIKGRSPDIIYRSSSSSSHTTEPNQDLNTIVNVRKQDNKKKMNTRKLILYIACSLDGYIAKPNDDLSFLDSVNKEGEDYGYNDFISSVDTVILGRKTYDWIKTRK